MWKLLGDFAKRIAFLAQDTQKNKADIKELQEQVQALAEEIRQMHFDSRHDRENAAHEHENGRTLLSGVRAAMGKGRDGSIVSAR